MHAPITTIVIQVREDREDFHGCISHVQVKGSGTPEQFKAALELAMKQAGAGLKSPGAIEAREYTMA